MSTTAPPSTSRATTTTVKSFGSLPLYPRALLGLFLLAILIDALYWAGPNPTTMVFADFFINFLTLPILAASILLTLAEDTDTEVAYAKADFARLDPKLGSDLGLVFAVTLHSCVLDVLGSFLLTPVVFPAWRRLRRGVIEPIHKVATTSFRQLLALIPSITKGEHTITASFPTISTEAPTLDICDRLETYLAGYFHPIATPCALFGTIQVKRTLKDIVINWDTLMKASFAIFGVFELRLRKAACAWLDGFNTPAGHWDASKPLILGSEIREALEKAANSCKPLYLSRKGSADSLVFSFVSSVDSATSTPCSTPAHSRNASFDLSSLSVRPARKVVRFDLPPPATQVSVEQHGERDQPGMRGTVGPTGLKPDAATQAHLDAGWDRLQQPPKMGRRMRARCKRFELMSRARARLGLERVSKPAVFPRGQGEEFRSQVLQHM